MQSHTLKVASFILIKNLHADHTAQNKFNVSIIAWFNLNSHVQLVVLLYESAKIIRAMQ